MVSLAKLHGKRVKGNAEEKNPTHRMKEEEMSSAT